MKKFEKETEAIEKPVKKTAADYGISSQTEREIVKFFLRTSVPRRIAEMERNKKNPE